MAGLFSGGFMATAAAKAAMREKLNAKALEEQKEAELYADMIDADTLQLGLSQLRAKFATEGELDISVFVYLVDGDGQGTDMRVWESNDPDTYNLKAIARKFGSGRYRLRVYAMDPEGRKPCVINRVQGVMLTPEEDSAVLAAKEAAKNPHLARSHNGESREMMQAMLAGFESLAAKLAPPAPPVDTLALFEKFSNAMRAANPPMPPAPDPFTQLAGMLSLMEKLKSITSAAVPDGASATETLLLQAGNALFPALAQGLVKSSENPAPATLPAPAALAPSAPATVSLTEEEEHMNLMQKMKIEAFKFQLKAANKAAARGTDAAAFAETMYDSFDEDDIGGLALQTDWFEVMCAAVPECAPHKDWYTRARAAVIALAVEDGILIQDTMTGVLTLAPNDDTSDKDNSDDAPNGTTRADADNGDAKPKPA